MEDFSVPEFNRAAFKCIESVIAAHAHIKTRLKRIPHLAYENTARVDPLTAKTLDSPPLGVGVPAIPGSTLSFFMRHES